jgi:XTP/dITP diphosphohydrolase
MQILLATSNPHKVDEIRAVFASLRNAASPRVELLGLKDLDTVPPEPEEDQPTFEGNAFLKARYYAKATGKLCLADDSGLEVDALGGEPGVRSARYAGVEGPRSVVDPANNCLLLEKLRDVPEGERTARFVCTIALCAPDRSAPLAMVRGTVEGSIILPEEATDPAQPFRGRGGNGFGYDPLFFISDMDMTAAELSPDQKNVISHRGKASRLMWEEIRRKLAKS